MIRTGGRLRPSTSAAVVVAAAVLALAGCTGSDPVPGPSLSPAQTVPTPAPTQTPTPAPTAPALPAAATKPTGAGAEAFIAHFIDLYNYALQTGDPTAMQLVSDPECTFCVSVAKGAQDFAAKGHRVRAAEAVVRGSSAAFGDPAEGLVVTTIIDQLSGAVVDRDGTVVRQLDEGLNRRMDSRVVWRDDAWHVVAVLTIPPAESTS